MKKLLIIIILLVTAAVGFYFGYWTNTPEKYSRQYKKKICNFLKNG